MSRPPEVHGAGQPELPSIWQRRIVAPILDQLRQGTAPDQVALTLVLGFTLGIFPILGATTLLCAVAGVRLRLNQPLIQLANYLAYPVQIALLIPFYRAGEWLFRQPPVPIFSVTDLAARFEAGPLRFLVDYGMVGLYGVVVWGLTAPPLAAVLYYCMRPMLRRQVGRQR